MRRDSNHIVRFRLHHIGLHSSALYVCMFFTCQIAFSHVALAQGQSLAQMLRTSWTGRNGAPQDIRALAQTPDGMLWIGSTAGLFSFDGLKFTAFEPAAGDPAFPSNAIRSLFVSRKGALWVEGSFVGAARIFKGHLTTLGDPGVRLFQIRQDSNGTIWGVRNYSQLVMLGPDEKWHPALNPLVRPGYVSSLFIDSSDTQWVVEDGHLYKRAKGQANFDLTEISTDGQAGFTEDGNHSIWMCADRLTVGTDHHARKLLQLDHSGKLLQTPFVKANIQNILAPGDGTVWLASPTRGILRLMPDYRDKRDRPQDNRDQKTLATPDMLSTSAPYALFRDTDGDIWVGGLRGLDRFQHANMVAATKGSDTGNWSVCTNPQGEVWVISDDAPLSVLRNGTSTQVRAPNGYSKLFCSTTGDVWFLDRLGIGLIHEHRFRQLPALPGHKDYGTQYNFIAFVDTSDHGLLASMGSAFERGLWKFAHGAWKPFAPRIYSGFAHALFRDDSGQVYVGRTDGKIFVFRESDAALIRDETTDLGVISAFCPTAYGLFVVGANGVAIERSGGFHKLLFAHPELANTVTGLIESDAGDLWINGSRGIVRVPAMQIRKALDSQTYAMEGIESREGDYIGPASFNNATASVAKDSKGKLWFSTLNGVVSLQTYSQPRAFEPPHIAILSVTADKRSLDASGTFAPHLQTLNIRYFGINLAHPDKVIYRYKLDGVDTRWQDVGNRTEAIYTRLKPGPYIFQVSASNDDGIWSQPFASVSFKVLPSFYQTIWFSAFCVFAAAIALWSLFAIRLRYVARTIRALAEERANERIRIARDLHDTLLQGVQGLMLSFHVAAQRLPQQDGSRQLLDRALITADRLMIEGRDRVSNLRAEHVTHAGLLNAIRAVAIDLSESTRVACNILSVGVARDLPPHVAGQVFYIAREALTNAFRHSDASQIDVELLYSRSEFALTCRDNGKGFDRQLFLAAHAEGHWGIRGIMERAAAIGGTIDWLSAHGGGTIVRFSLPRSRFAAFYRWLSGVMRLRSTTRD